MVIIGYRFSMSTFGAKNLLHILVIERFEENIWCFALTFSFVFTILRPAINLTCNI